MTTDETAHRNRNALIVTLRITIAIKHNDRPKLPSASGKTNTLIAAVKEGRWSSAYLETSFLFGEWSWSEAKFYIWKLFYRKN